MIRSCVVHVLVEQQFTPLLLKGIHPDGDERGLGVPDSLHLSTGQLHLAGGATLRIEEKRVIIRALVTPDRARTREKPLPLQVELQAVLQAGVLTGVATIQQRIPGSISSFDAIGRFKARCVVPRRGP